MVGYPGETEEDFANLCEFVAKWEFDNLGAFTYSREKGTRLPPASRGTHKGRKEEAVPADHGDAEGDLEEAPRRLMGRACRSSSRREADGRPRDAPCSRPRTWTASPSYGATARWEQIRKGGSDGNAGLRRDYRAWRLKMEPINELLQREEGEGGVLPQRRHRPYPQDRGDSRPARRFSGVRRPDRRGAREEGGNRLLCGQDHGLQGFRQERLSPCPGQEGRIQVYVRKDILKSPDYDGLQEVRHRGHHRA